MQISDQFTTDFTASRAAFTKQMTALRAELVTIPVTASTWPDSAGPPSIDIGVLGSLKAPNVLLHIAGTHGVEAPVGAAIQREIQRGLASQISARDPKTAIVFLHCLNPWGMGMLRRTNEENIDLNRNSVYPPQQRSGEPALRSHLSAVLHPQQEPGQLSFYLRALRTVVEHGFAAAQRAIVGGQYVDSKGLYFGGKHEAQELTLLQGWARTTLAHAERVVIVDLHTGLGGWQHDALIIGHGAGSPEHTRITALFGAESAGRVEVEDEIAFRTSGGLEHLFRTALPGTQLDFVTHELGTYHPLVVLHGLVQENYRYHHQPPQAPATRSRKLLEVFCPSSLRWRNWALRRGQAIFQAALKQLREG